MDHSALPYTKDVLGEHLFTKVSQLESEKIEQITGVLLGTSNDDILRMLQDNDYLKVQIDGVKRVLSLTKDEDVVNCNVQENNFNTSPCPKLETLGEQLFNKVKALEPDHAAKVTGMILEMDSKSVSFLLNSSNEHLREIVTKACKALHIPESSLTSDKTAVGEELFEHVKLRHPHLASEITGMLLEMDVASLQKLLQEHELLKEKIEDAASVLMSIT